MAPLDGAEMGTLPAVSAVKLNVLPLDVTESDCDGGEDPPAVAVNERLDGLTSNTGVTTNTNNG